MRSFLTVFVVLSSVLQPLITAAAAPAGAIEEADKGSPSAMTATPLVEKRGLFFVNVRASGNDLLLLVDTGAGKSILHAATARKLALSHLREISVQGASGSATGWELAEMPFEVGNAVTAVHPLAVDLSDVRRTLGMKFDGILGLDFFRGGRVVEIDGPARTLRVLPGWPVGRKATAYLRPVNDAVGVSAVVGGIPRLLRLDTGCEGGVQLVAAKGGSRGYSKVSFGALAKPRSAGATDLVLGNISLRQVEVGMSPRSFFPGEDGLLGNAVLGRKRMTIDVSGGRLLLGE